MARPRFPLAHPKSPHGVTVAALLAPRIRPHSTTQETRLEPKRCHFRNTHSRLLAHTCSLTPPAYCHDNREKNRIKVNVIEIEGSETGMDGWMDGETGEKQRVQRKTERTEREEMGGQVWQQQYREKEREVWHGGMWSLKEKRRRRERDCKCFKATEMEIKWWDGERKGEKEWRKEGEHILRNREPTSCSHSNPAIHEILTCTSHCHCFCLSIPPSLPLFFQSWHRACNPTSAKPSSKMLINIW